MQRKLTVILSADVAGYTALMERDETGTLHRLKKNRAAIFDPALVKHGGRLIKLMGDGALVEFASAAAAVACAMDLQRAMETEESARPDAQRLRYRIGINLGDVIVDGDDLYGEGVNLAARLQALAPPGGIAVSRTVADQVSGKIEATLEDLGAHTVKNIERPVHVVAVNWSDRLSASPKPAAAPKRTSVCVLPFANISGDLEQDYFADGVSEDIITDLSKVSALAVVSRNTAFTYKGKNIAVPHLARELNVTHVLEGSVRKAGNRVRITAQLIDAKTDAHIWAERYDRDLSDIFALQDEISEAIVEALKIRLLPEEKRAIENRGTADPRAYQYYLLARRFTAGGALSNRVCEVAVRLCEKAVQLDPNYARAWTLLAKSKARLFFNGRREHDGLPAANQAVLLDPKSAEAHAIKARMLMVAGQYEEAEAEIALAMALDPEAFEVNSARASIHFVRGRFKEAAPFYERAAAAEDDCTHYGMLATVYAAVGDKAATERVAPLVIERAEKIIAREPDNTMAIVFLVSALGLMGQAERAREWIDRALIIDPDDFTTRYGLACILARDLGDSEAAIALFEGMDLQELGGSLAWIKADPDLDSVRDHPRFQALLAAAERKLKEQKGGG